MGKLSTEARIEIYTQCMMEVKQRAREMALILSEGEKLPFRTRTTWELLYLHVRMICEWIALGCVVCYDASANNQTSVLSGRYRADLLLKHLAGKSPMHYPIAVKVSETELVTIVEQPLPASTLWEMYRKCDKILHAGTVKEVLKSQSRGFDLKFLAEFQSKVVRHLNQHTIHLTGAEKLLLITMQLENSDDIHYAILELRATGVKNNRY